MKKALIIVFLLVFCVGCSFLGKDKEIPETNPLVNLEHADEEGYYEVSFYDDDGTFLGSYYVQEGSDITDIPKENLKYPGELSEWNGKLENITEDRQFVATYKDIDNFAFTLGSNKGKVGDEIEISLYVKNNPGFISALLSLSFDDDLLELMEIEDVNTSMPFLDFTPSKNLKNGCVLFWDGVYVDFDKVEDCALLKLKFKILKTSESGVIPVSLITAEGDVIDNDLETLLCETYNGLIYLVQ